MASLYNADLKPLDPNGRTHPYDHATKLFLADNYRLTPKQSFLYYVVLNIDTTSSSIGQSFLQTVVGNDVISSQSSMEQIEAGMLVKRVELPRFSFQTKTLNAYNKKNIVQTQIQYDPVTITFHDDNDDIVTNFWNDYYTYYYRDSDYSFNPGTSAILPLRVNDVKAAYDGYDEYQQRPTEGWGYGPRNGSVRPFLKSIQIFSLHQKRFTEYTLINPMITTWRHGQHSADGSNELMENAMTVAYETVKYRTGYVNGVDVNGFSVLHYDNFESPIATSTTNIYTDGGLVGALAGSAKDLARPDGTNGSNNVFSNLLDAYRLFNQDINFSSVASVALGQIGAQVLNGAVNSAINTAFFPTASGTAGYGSVYGSSQVYTGTSTLAGSSYASPVNSSAVTLGGTAAALVGGAAKTTLSQAISSYTDNYTRGVTTNQTAGLPGASASTVYQVGNNNGTIVTNPQGEPVTGQTTGYVYNSDGSLAGPAITVYTTASGALNLNNLAINRLEVTHTTDQEGNAVYAYGYADGSAVIVDAASGDIKQVYLGSNSTGISVPENTRNKVINGEAISPTAVQYYTDPATGITYTVGGTTGAYVTNTLSAAGGAVVGGYIGSGVTQALNSTALGKTVIGQTISTALGSAAGIVTGRAVNNGLQPIINNFTGTISQGWDSLTGAIKNIVGSWTGTGGLNVNEPNQNLVTTSFDAITGLRTNTYKDGTVAILDEFNDILSTTPGTSAGSNWWNSLGSAAGNASDLGTNLVWTDSWGNPILTGTGDYVYTSDPFAQSLYESNQYYDNTWGGIIEADNYGFGDLSGFQYDSPTYNFGDDPGFDIFYG